MNKRRLVGTPERPAPRLVLLCRKLTINRPYDRPARKKIADLLIGFFRFARIAKHSGQVTFSGSAVVSTISLTRGSPKQTLPTRLHGVSMAPRRSRPPPLSLRKCLAASLFFAVIFSHCLRHHATSAFLVPLIAIRECHVHDQPTIRT